MSFDPEIAAYRDALAQTLRLVDPAALRRFAASWGPRLRNRGLQELARADDATVERRLWMMLRDRPDMPELQDRAEEWLADHDDAPPLTVDPGDDSDEE